LKDRQPGILRKLRIRGRPSAKIESGAPGRFDPLHIAAVSAQTDWAPLPVCIVTDHSAFLMLLVAKVLTQILTAETSTRDYDVEI